MADEKEYLTKEKFAELEAELEHLKTVRRKEVADSLEYAKSLGDLSENAEYQEAREMQENLEERVGKLELVLNSAVIVSEHHSDVVGVGSVVVIQRDGEQSTKRYLIIGSEEANTAEGKLSNRSPLGEALMGKRKGDAFAFTAPKGLVKYTIVSIQ